MARVLIVEDEAVVAVDLSMLLQAAGHEVTAIAADGAAALAGAQHDEPDLVLMDLTIQGELDGIETARLLRERIPELKIVFLTAHSDAATRKRADAVEPNGFLLKPFSDDELKSALGLALVQGPQRARPAPPEP